MKMMNFRIALLAIAGVQWVACTNGSKGDITATVLTSEEVVVSEISPQQLIPLDTLTITDGQFDYTPKSEVPIFLLFEFDGGARVPVLYTPGDEISLTINDTVEYGTFVAEGSESVQRMARQRDIFVKTAFIFDSLNDVSSMYTDSTNFGLVRSQLNDAFASRMEEHRTALLKIIDEDTTDLSNLMAFYQSLGRIEFLDVTRDYAYYRKVANGLKAVHPNNAHTAYFIDRLERYQHALNRQQEIEAAASRLLEGTPAPEISLPGLDGQVRNLSALRGKLVLIDFWASWCAPCRRANPILVKAYEKYNARGFEIFSVSLDGIPQQPNAQNDWRFAIESDKLTWPNHVSDLKGYESQVVNLYGFNGIPFTVLVGRDGSIIAKNVTPDKLDELIKKHL